MSSPLEPTAEGTPETSLGTSPDDVAPTIDDSDAAGVEIPTATDTSETPTDTSPGEVPPPIETADATEAEIPAPEAAETAETGDIESPSVSAGDPDHTDAEPPSEHPLVRDLMLNPSRWRIWPAVAVLRWLQRRMRSTAPRMVFRSHPSLAFAASEVRDIHFKDDQIEIVLNAPGLATAGSPMPSSDIARIIADYHQNGALSIWLDGPGDRFMHILEDVQRRSDPAYALLAGEGIEAFTLTRDLVGRSVPLIAKRGAELHESGSAQPQGAVALAGLFLGPISASGLRGLFHALTGLTTRVREFAGAEIDVARPARIGQPFGSMLGTFCNLPEAGVEVHIEGGDRPTAQAWAREATRRASLHYLATAYIGAPSPAVRVYLWLNGNNAPPAALDGQTALGGLAVLGTSVAPVAVPLAP